MCNSSASTVTLVRVKSRGSDNNEDGVVGGFSSVPWGGIHASTSGDDGTYCAAPGSFLFMLKDGSGTGPGHFLPERWGVLEGHETEAVYGSPSFGPTFGYGYDLIINWNVRASTTFATLTHTYGIPDGARFSTLTGRPVVELEVFGLCSATTTVEP